MMNIRRKLQELINAGKTKEEAEKEAPIMKKTQQMLLEWEQGKAGCKRAVENDEWLGLQGF